MTATGAHAARGRVQNLARTMHRSGTGRAVARTAGFNMAGVVAAGIGGVIIARTVGPTARGEYAAITAWFGVALIFAEIGQPAALCFYVARDPMRAREYVATSRAMMIVTGTATLMAGILLAPVLSHGNSAVTIGYRIAFGASIVAYVGASYTFSLQARDLRQWNVVRTSQPVLFLLAIGALWLLRLLTLHTALIVMGVALFVQFCWAYRCNRVIGLAPGRPQADLIWPLAAYGAAQMAALTPTALNSQLDQLVLSQTVAPADLGRYAIAVSLTSLPVPLVSAIGNVAFPRLAAWGVVSDATRRLQKFAIIGSFGLAAGMLIPLAVAAYWLVPLVFGPAYRAAVPLIWILAPGSVFLACGQVVGDLLRGRNHPTVVAWAQGVAAIFTVVLLIVLLPVVGVSGAAITSSIAYGIALAVMLRSLWRLPRHARGRVAMPRVMPPDREISSSCR
jgi:O-antigen/teichoic acid export membrane protein